MQEANKWWQKISDEDWDSATDKYYQNIDNVFRTRHLDKLDQVFHQIISKFIYAVIIFDYKIKDENDHYKTVQLHYTGSDEGIKKKKEYKEIHRIYRRNLCTEIQAR